VTRRRSLLAALALGLVLALAACTGMPTSGPVQPGLAPAGDTAPPAVAYFADAPRDGMTPEQIVDGFIQAGSDPRDNWGIARMYLAPDIHESWQPTESATVDLLAARTVTATGPDTVSVQLTPTGLVDANGVYSASDSGPTPLSFQLAQVDGQWRISRASNGIVLDSAKFRNVYESYSLMYFDPTWRFLVPDVRWYPRFNAPTRIASALVSGSPSPWLEKSVVTAFPPDLVVRAAVPVVDGTAEVELSAEALSLSSDTLDRMQTQLATSLATASVADVRMTVGGAVLAASPVATEPTSVGGRPLVDATSGGFGFLTGGEQIDPVPGLSAAVEAVEPRAIETSANGSFAAVRDADGRILRVPAAGATAVADTRAGLVDPTVDPEDHIWTVPADTPAAVVAVGAQGTRIDIANAWPSASRIASMQVSRDGTRVVALVTTGGRTALWIAGVIRDASGAPSALGPAQQLGLIAGTGVAVAWTDAQTVMAVARDGDETTVTEQVVGGTASTSSAPAEADAIAGDGETDIFLRGVDGALYVRRGANWQLMASGIAVLATQQGRVVPLP